MNIDRRHFLTASGSALLLPQLEAFAQAKTAPQRLVFLGFSYGFTEDFFVQKPGRDFELPPGMKPLQRHRRDLSLISNLWHRNSREPHSGTVSYLTGANCLNTPGKRFHNTVSCDQIAARHLGRDTRFASLQVTSPEREGHGGGSSLSWNENGKSMSGIAQPFRLFNLLFGGEAMSYEERLAKLQRRKSVLDGYASNIQSLNRRVSAMDRERLDQYFQSIREIEQRIAKEKLWANKPKPGVSYRTPKEQIRNGIEEIKTMYDLMILAMQTDLSRVLTYRQPLESLLKTMNITYSGHQISHYHGSENRRRDAEKRELKQTELFAGFIDQLKATRDFDGSRLFDNCLVSYGSNIRTGHMLKNVPAFLTGNAKNRIKHGRHVVMPEDTALCNLWLTLLQACEVPVESFGDSNGTLDELFA
ncbi:MAG: DUF1552 domain-containing protein [Limisphaerales bacterium]